MQRLPTRKLKRVKGNVGNSCNFSLYEGATSYKSHQRPLGVTKSSMARQSQVANSD